MKEIIFKPVEKVINFYLQRDPEIASRLKKFEGQSLRVNLTDIEKFFFITFDSEKVRFLEASESVPQVMIAGHVFSLLQLLLNKEAGMVSEFGIQIQGDLFFLQELKEIFSLIEVDWEDVLSPLEEVHDWYDEVWVLRDDVERIEAKLLILEESS